MELPNHFERFVRNISLDDTRRGKIEGAINNLSSFLANDVLGDLMVSEMFFQGSWAHKTVVRPIKEEQEYDVDVVLPVDASRRPRDKQNPDAFLAYVKSRLDTYVDYAGKVTRRGCCVRITFSGLFHLDLVPAHGTSDPNKPFLVPNRYSGQWEASNPSGYVAWLDAANAGRSRFLLQPATKAIKRWRDFRLGDASAPKSIVLTTLLGWYNPGRVSQSEVNFPLFYPETGSLAAYLTDTVNILFVKLSAFGSPPGIPNPTLPDENLGRNWQPDAYRVFLSRLDTLRDRVNKAYAQRSQDYAINWWRDAFGDAFPVNP